MFNAPTVIILGAGASKHYGYPIGEELVREVSGKASQIIGAYQRTELYVNAIPKHLSDPDHLREFTYDVGQLKIRLDQVQPLMIDLFLGAIEPKLANICKLLIAMVLFDHDRKDLIQPKNLEENDWIRFVVHQLIVGCEHPEQLLENALTFVTFNYDLSLEHRLYLALDGMDWFKKDNIAEIFVTKNRIYHVYGQLYDFEASMIGNRNRKIMPEKLDTFERQLLIASQIDTAYIPSQRLRTIAPGEKTVPPEVQPGIDAIAKAEHLYILGYGFDPHNNEILGLGECAPETPYSRYVYFTNFENQNKVNKQVGRVFSTNKNDLYGDNYHSVGIRHTLERREPRTVYFNCEKSIKDVYGALAYDFDLPG